MGILNPWEVLAPRSWPVGGNAAKHGLERLFGTFGLPIRLRVVPGRETGRGPNPLAKGLPHPCSKLGATVRNDVARDTVCSNHVLDQEVGGLCGGWKPREGDKMGGLRKSIHDGQNDRLPTGWRKACNEIHSHM